jgi:transposase-like protein
MNRTAFTPEIKERMLQGFRLGNYVHTVCASVGITKETFYQWMKKARSGDKKFAPFARKVAEALSIAEMRDLATIQKASAEQWQAAAWRLERRYPHRWGRKYEQRVAATVAHVATSILDLPSRMPPAAVRTVVAALLEHETDEARRTELEKVQRAVEGL